LPTSNIRGSASLQWPHPSSQQFVSFMSPRRGSISPVPFLHRCSYAPCSACPFCLREHAGLFLRALPMPVPFRPLWWGPLRRGAMCHPLHPVAGGQLVPVLRSAPPQCLRATSRSPRGVISLISLRYPCVPMPPPLPSVCVAPSLSSIPHPFPPPLSLDRCVFFHHMQMPRICTRPSPPPPRSSYETILSSRASPPRGRAPRPSSPTSILYGPHTVPPSRVPRVECAAIPGIA